MSGKPQERPYTELCTHSQTSIHYRGDNLADDVLGRRGRMVDAVEAMGDYEYSGVGVPFDFAVRY